MPQTLCKPVEALVEAGEVLTRALTCSARRTPPSPLVGPTDALRVQNPEPTCIFQLVIDRALLLGGRVLLAGVGSQSAVALQLVPTIPEYPPEPDQTAVQIVHHLVCLRRLGEKDGQRSGERFYVPIVLGKAGHDLSGDTLLAAKVGHRWEQFTSPCVRRR